MPVGLCMYTHAYVHACLRFAIFHELMLNLSKSKLEWVEETRLLEEREKVGIDVDGAPRGVPLGWRIHCCAGSVHTFLSSHKHAGHSFKYDDCEKYEAMEVSVVAHRSVNTGRD